MISGRCVPEYPKITTPKGDDPIDNDDGTTTLPGGGTIETEDGTTIASGFCRIIELQFQKALLDMTGWIGRADAYDTIKKFVLKIYPYFDIMLTIKNQDALVICVET